VKIGAGIGSGAAFIGRSAENAGADTMVAAARTAKESFFIITEFPNLCMLS